MSGTGILAGLGQSGGLSHKANPSTAPKSPFYMTDAFTSNAVKLIDEYGRKRNPYFL